MQHYTEQWFVRAQAQNNFAIKLSYSGIKKKDNQEEKYLDLDWNADFSVLIFENFHITTFAFCSSYKLPDVWQL
jgi:hypothetical protein